MFFSWVELCLSLNTYNLTKPNWGENYVLGSSFAPLERITFQLQKTTTKIQLIAVGEN